MHPLGMQINGSVVGLHVGCSGLHHFLPTGHDGDHATDVVRISVGNVVQHLFGLTDHFSQHLKVTVLQVCYALHHLI